MTWVKVVRIIPEFRILRLIFHRKSASKCWIGQILIASDLFPVNLGAFDHLNWKLFIIGIQHVLRFELESSGFFEILNPCSESTVSWLAALTGLGILSGIPSVCNAVWIQIRPDILSGLIRIQTVCKGYFQQTTKMWLAGKGFKGTEAFDLSRFVYSAYQYHFIWLTMGYLPVLMVIFYVN